MLNINIKNLALLAQLEPKIPVICRINKNVKYWFAKQIQTKTSKKIVIGNKYQKQLVELKKQLAKKQPIKSQKLYEQYHYRDVYKKINTQMESFFYERPYTLQNFNFLLNIIAEQATPNSQKQIQQVIHKMSIMNIKPDQKSYNYMIKAAGNIKNVQLSQKIFKQACSKFLPNKYLYTSLMQVYVKNNDPAMALKLLDEMVQTKLQPDLPTYTTLINCFRKGRNLQKCWEVHRKMIKSKIQPDQTYTGVMMKVYAATHDAQKVVKLYKQNITDKGIKPMIETINSYFKALSIRKQYSHIVIDKFFQLIEQGQIVNTQTANWALRACSTIRNLKSASQILKLMKIKQIPIQKQTLNILLKVYAASCLVPNLDQKLRDIVTTDSWKLLQQINKINGVDTTVLNNMLLVYANSIASEQIQGLIIPLYQKFKQPYNMYTYQILMKMYYKNSDFNKAMRIWTQMKKHIMENKQKMVQKYEDFAQYELQMRKANQQIRPTFYSLHAYLDIGIKMMDMKQVLDALDMFKKYKKMPKNQTLKFLGNLKNLPQEIQASLMDFKITFGKAKIAKKHIPNFDDPQNK